MPVCGSAKPREPPAPGEPKAPACPNVQFGHVFMKPRENSDLPFERFVIEAVRRWNRRRDQLLKSFLPKTELPASSCEHAVCLSHSSSGANATAGGHFEIARIDALFVQRQPRYRDSQ